MVHAECDDRSISAGSGAYWLGKKFRIGVEALADYGIDNLRFDIRADWLPGR